uniref:poly(ADP-ribose) glycohydrolase n=1 Tax=Clastoptera arizonana TaxID=38151 RepID=A0A1B6C9X7_9HEMI
MHCIHFFKRLYKKKNQNTFFANVLPKIIKLALSLPKLITGSIPLLHQKKTHSISLSQQQISCLLANAFLCTFPRRNSSKRHSEFNSYPDINFNRLFGGHKENNSIQEKLKCLINYFRRVCDKVPDGVVTYSRHYFPDKKCSNWKNETKQLPNLHVSSAGAIEEQGLGFIQMDFANKFVGGGVLSRGCVQEEIRFVICPELIAARLFTECLDDTEVLIVTGIERFSNYKGYSDSFQWAGNYQDNTASDSYNRRYCTVVACDALCFLDANVQYAKPNIVRELNKAYSGFSWGSQDGCNTSIATGNWGCGAFRGDPYLKAFIQLMAAGKAGRDVAYFTFGDVILRDRLLEIHTLLRNKNINIGQLYEIITGYNDVSRSIELYSYLYNALSKSDYYTYCIGLQGYDEDKEKKNAFQENMFYYVY